MLVTLDDAHLLDRPDLEAFGGVRTLGPELAHALLWPAETGR